jgi:hypothetical protein
MDRNQGPRTVGIGGHWRQWNEQAPELSALFEECRHASRKREFGFQAGIFEMLFGKGRWVSVKAKACSVRGLLMALTSD